MNLKDYKRARENIRLLKELEPENQQVQSLDDHIRSHLEREAFMGLTIVSGTICAISIIGSILFTKSKKTI